MTSKNFFYCGGIQEEMEIVVVRDWRIDRVDLAFMTGVGT
jgi:hypothetical protein